MTTTTVDPRANGVYQAQKRISFAQEITPDEATKMLVEMKYDHQRPPRPKKVRAYADAIAKGQFAALTQIYIAIYHGRHFILDGQHRLRAVVAAGIPVLFSIVECDVTSEREMSDIYSRLDRGLRRTPNDIYGAYALKEEFGLTATEVKSLGQAIRFMSTGCFSTGEDMPVDTLVERMRNYAPEMQTYSEITDESRAQRGLLSAGIRRSSTVAAVLLSLRFTGPKAEREGKPAIEDFWAGTFTDDGLRIGDPRKAAHKHLVETRIQSSRTVATASASYAVRYLGHCINAYIAVREQRYSKVFDEKAPLNIYGVPSEPDLWW